MKIKSKADYHKVLNRNLKPSKRESLPLGKRHKKKGDKKK